MSENQEAIDYYYPVTKNYRNVHNDEAIKEWFVGTEPDAFDGKQPKHSRAMSVIAFEAILGEFLQNCLASVSKGSNQTWVAHGLLPHKDKEFQPLDSITEIAPITFGLGGAVVEPPSPSYVTPEEIIEVERYLDDFDRKAAETAKRAKVKVRSLPRLSVAGGAGAGIAIRIAVHAAAKFEQLSELKKATGTSKRTTRHKECYRACLTILSDASKELSRLNAHRALSAFDSEYRKRRKGRSRA